MFCDLYQFFQDGVIHELEDKIQLPLSPENFDQIDQVFMSETLKIEILT